MLPGCRFVGLKSIIIEDAEPEPSGVAVTEAKTAFVFPDGVSETYPAAAEEELTATPTAREVTAEESASAEPEQLMMIDICDLFRMGKGINQDVANRKPGTTDVKTRVSGVTYEYGACTGYIQKTELEEFFYSGKAFYGDNPFVAFVYEYADAASGNLLRRKPLLLEGDRYDYRYSPDCGAIRITFSIEKASVKSNRQGLTEEILRENFGISPIRQKALYCRDHIDDPDALRFGSSDAENNRNPGIGNMLAMARQEASVQYELKGDLPAQIKGGHIPATDGDGNPTKMIGLPYSSARSNDKMINLNVSVYTFLTAIRNPRSVLYTRRIGSDNAKTFYGTVCSVFTDYSQGIPWNLPTKFLRSERFSRAYSKKQIGEMTVGDVFINSTHIILVTDLYRDAAGTVKAVEFSEAKAPVVRTTTLNYAGFKGKMEAGSYQCFSYRGVSQIKYRSLPFLAVKEGESAEPIDYPDIMCEFGDKAVLMGGGSSAADFEREVTINVLDREGYYAIQVYRDGVHPIDYDRSDRDYELLETRSTVTDFVMGDPENGLIPGAYKIVMRGVDKTSTTEFFVVDAACLYKNDRLYWKSENASADIVFLYSDDPKNDPILLSKANVTASDLYGYDSYLDLAPRKAENEAAGDTDCNNVKITFRTKYGTATWYSYFEKNWVRRIGG